MIGSYIRRRVFWLTDKLKGGLVKAAYNDIEKKMSSGYNSENEIRELLNHAVKNVPFYKNLINEGSVRLSSFPVMTKADYKANYDNFMSYKYKGKSLHEMSTSGSTGTPFTVKMNSEKRKRVNAEFIYFYDIAGQKLGDRYMYLKTWKKRKSKIESLAQNVIAIDILRLTETTLEAIRSKLKADRKIKSLLAYASTYDILADYLISKGDSSKDFNIRVVFTSSTLMSPVTKSKLEKLFGCSVIDRYSSQENGLLAQTSHEEDFFRVNTASYHIELLNLEDDQPVSQGQLGRVVVTDLSHYAMPMIRYDTGDLAVSDDIDRTNIRTLRNLEGRQVDLIYDTQGNKLTPHTWSVQMRKYDKLLQWQFIQEDKKSYCLKVNGGDDYPESDFQFTLKSVLGQDAQVKIEFVKNIPVLSSGKFKNTICLYDPKAE